MWIHLACVELVLIVATIGVIIIGWTIFATSKQFHPNMRWLIFGISILAFISVVLRFCVVICTFLISSDFAYNETLIWQSRVKYFDYACYVVRLSVFNMMGFIAVERLFACILLSDYENRKYFVAIACGYVVLFALSASVTAAIVNRYIPLFACGILGQTVNAIYVMLFIGMYWWNLGCFRKSLNDPNTYTLSQRFQLSENLRTSAFLAQITVFMFVVNIFIVGMYVCIDYLTTQTAQHLARAGFHISVLIYTIVLPLLGIRYVEPWRRAFFKIFNHGICKRRSRRIGNITVTEVEGPPIAKLRHVRNQAGKMMVFNTTREKELHFSQLRESWN